MDTQIGFAPEAAATAPAPPDVDGLAAFEHFLLTHCSVTQSDEELWRCVARGVARLERDMDASQVERFEIAIDFILSRRGLPSWAVIKERLARRRDPA